MSTFLKFKSRPGAVTSATAAKRGRAPWGRMRGAAGRRTGKDRAAMALAVAKQALRATRKLNAQRELKFFEEDLVNLDLGIDVTGQYPGATGAVIGNGGACFPLAYIAQGVTESTRVGEHIQVKQIEIRGHFTNNFMACGALRMIVFRDKQTTSFSGQPLPANVLQVLRTNSLYLYDNVDRWEIYHDETMEWNQVNDVGYPTRTGFQFKKKVDVDCEFSGAGANSIEKNGLYLLLIMDYYPGGALATDTTVVVPAAGNYGLIDLTTRVMFQDP